VWGQWLRRAALIEAAVEGRVVGPQCGLVHLNADAEEEREVVLHLGELIVVNEVADGRLET